MEIARPRSLTSLVAEQLTSAIESGGIAPGTMLNEKQVAKEYGTSKTPVREAFVQLQSVGLLEVMPQRGGIVFKADETQVRELCEVRLELETVALRFAFQRGHEQLVDRMRSVVKKMDESFDLARPTPYLTYDDEFHRSFFESCGNSLLQQAYALFTPRIRALRTHLSAPQSFPLKVSLDDHRRMFDLVAFNDLEGAASLLRDHIVRVEEMQLAQLREGEPLVVPQSRRRGPARTEE